MPHKTLGGCDELSLLYSMLMLTLDNGREAKSISKQSNELGEVLRPPHGLTGPQPTIIDMRGPAPTGGLVAIPVTPFDGGKTNKG